MVVSAVVLAFLLGMIVGTVLQKPSELPIVAERRAALAAITGIEKEVERLYTLVHIQSVADTLCYVKTVRHQWENREVEVEDVRPSRFNRRPRSSPGKSDK